MKRDKKNNLPSGSYYDGPQDSKEMKPQDIEKEMKRLSKENSILKSELCVNALEKFKNRRSVRKYSTKPVQWELIYAIVEAALNAPCAGNVENSDIIVIQDKKTRVEVGKIENQQFWLSDAPYLLVVVRDNQRLIDLYPGEGELYAVQNTAAVIQNVLMMAHFYELGACWVESCDNRVLKEFLGIPENKYVDAVIPLGFPLENPKMHKSHPISRIFFEKYGNKKRN